MEYIEIKDNIIIGHYCGDMPQGDDDGIPRIEIANPIANIGEDIRIYSDLHKGIKKPLQQLIDEGLTSIPEGKKLNADGTDFEDMSEADKVRAGLITLEATQKLEGGFIVEKTKKELHSEGLFSAEAYNAYIDEKRQQAYSQEADPLAFQVLRGKIEKSIWLEKIDEIKSRYQKIAV